jgi:hypothetical protein
MRETQMRLLIVPVFVLVATPALALDMPARKPGLWELKMTMEAAACRHRPSSTASMRPPTKK